MNRIQKKIRQKIALIILIILMIAVYSFRFFYRSIDKEQYQTVAVGMTEDRIKNLLGEPVKITHYFCPTHGSSEVWYYNIKYSLFTISIWFKPDKNGLTVVFDKTWGFE